MSLKALILYDRGRAEQSRFPSRKGDHLVNIIIGDIRSLCMNSIPAISPGEDHITLAEKTFSCGWGGKLILPSGVRILLSGPPSPAVQESVRTSSCKKMLDICK